MVRRLSELETAQTITMMFDYYAQQGAPYGWETKEVRRWFMEHWEAHRLGDYYANVRQCVRRTIMELILKNAEAAMQ